VVAVWGLFACDFHPGPGWIWIGKNPDGLCCWYKGHLADIVPTPIAGEIVNECLDQCEPSEI
jgi:hypothetical protein